MGFEGGLLGIERKDGRLVPVFVFLFGGIVLIRSSVGNWKMSI